MPTAAGIYFALSEGGHNEQAPVILIHGAGSSHQVWPAAIRRLAGQRVYAVDLPGHGRTPGIGLQSISAHADQMVEFLAALGLYQAVFVGHSMGGAIALDLAVRHAEHVAGLGLIASGAYLGVQTDLLNAFSNTFTLNGAFHLFQQRAFGAAAPASMTEKCMSAMREVRPSVLAADWYACSTFDVREAAGQISAPAWVIVGSEDRICPVVYSHFLAGKLPAARMQIIGGAGHMVILEQPQRVAQGLQQFLTALHASRFTAARVRSTNPQGEIVHPTTPLDRPKQMKSERLPSHPRKRGEK